MDGRANNGSLPGEDRTASPLLRICPECGEAFVGRSKKHVICSPKCRVRRTRRKQAGKEQDPLVAARAAERAEMAAKTADEGALAIVQDIIRTELTPVVREHLTAGIMRSIGDLVDLTPLMVAALKDDLTALEVVLDDNLRPIEDDDGNILYRVDKARRQRAVAIVAKYTIGSPGLAPQAETNPQPISVNFGNLPRPDWDAQEPERECDLCHEWKLEDEFDAGAPRCRDCQDTISERAVSLIDERADTTRG